MDYQLNVYPSSERDLQNVRADNITKQIKVLQENKLQALYKKTFGPAVKKFNERATSGKLIDNYYKSIVDSNIPEVYKLSIVIRYELLNKNDIAAIQKAFLDFKKAFEKEEKLVLVSAYSMSYDEYKELQIFFFPISSGYATGLSARNDFIDVTKKLCNVENNIDIVKAMPLFVDYIDNIFDTVNDGLFISQEELEAQAQNKKEVNPMALHAIAVDTLKTQMNKLQRITDENRRLEQAVENEKERIKHDIVWSKQAAIDIKVAEQARIEEERRLEEERRREEAARLAAEAQRREEERLREEERRIEAERFAEQARRNIALKKQMAKHDAILNEVKNLKYEIDLLDFSRMLEDHIAWQSENGVESSANFDRLSNAALSDPRRLTLKSVSINNAKLDDMLTFIGVTLTDCEFINCDLSLVLGSSNIDSCSFINCKINDVVIDKCIINTVDLDMLFIDNIRVDESTIIKASLKEATVSEVLSSPGTSYINCDFSSATFKGCDMKKNAFSNCNFNNSNFVSCDMRESAFQVCKTDEMNTDGSLFRGAKFSTK